MFDRLYSLLGLFGLDFKKTIRSLRGLIPYFRDLRALKNQLKIKENLFPLGKIYPCLEDRFSKSGQAMGHYFHQDLLVARRIYLNGPLTHVDIGSRIDGFVAHVACFRKIEVFDIRPQPNKIKNIRFRQADLISEVDDGLVDYCDSLSCLHALEHFGLGRYGDPVNIEGYALGLSNLQRILKKGGRLYFSVPIGPQRIEFNAHRVFSVQFLLEYFTDKYQIEQFSFVDDQGLLHENVVLSNDNVESNFGCNFGCGIFEMIKI